MAVPYALTLSEIISAALAALAATLAAPAIEITGLGSLGPAAALTAAVAGYRKYNKDMNRLAEEAHYSDRNANRLIRNIGQTRTPVRSSFSSARHRGSVLNPILLEEVVVTPNRLPIPAISIRDLTASTDSTRTAPADPAPSDTTITVDPGGSTSQGTSSGGSVAPANPNPNNKKGFRERLKQVLDNLKKGYSNALVGLEYGLGFGLPVGGLVFGGYKLMLPGKTKADSILDSLLYLVGELNKAVLINENLKKIDAILQLILSGSPLTQSNDSNYIAPQLVVNPTDTLDF